MDANDATRIAELEADNLRLRRLLDARGAPEELRHRLRSTVGMLRAIIRRSAESRAGDIESYIAHIEDRMDAIARAQSQADSRGWIDLHDLIAEELFRYGAGEGERAVLDGPCVRLRPRAGQILALAFHELAVNAIEHGVLGQAEGRVRVDWSLQDGGQRLGLLWQEQGARVQAEPVRSGFGTEVLTRMLRYELKAETDLAFERDGLRCSITMPMSDAVGMVNVP
jgi:two-component sensor histidine kinase